MADWAKESDAAAAVMQAADRALGEQLSELIRALGEQLSELIAHGPDTELNLTVNTQPALLATSYAVFAAWKEAGGPTPEVMAGHSLGEYTALTAAGVFSIEDAVRLVRFRASAMQSAVPVGVGGMAAILGLSDEVVIDLCANAAQGEAVEAVNFNCPGQVVISGSIEGINKACELMKEAGAKRALPLKVGGAFHSPLMNPAKVELEAAIKATTFHQPKCPVYQNVDALPHTSAEEIKTNLIAQLTSSVRWTQTVKNMINDGASEFIECGPGAVLQGLIKNIDKEANAHGIA